MPNGDDSWWDDRVKSGRLYRASWDDAFAQFVASIEEYVALDLPADCSPAERRLQSEIGKHLQVYKEAKAKEEEKENHWCPQCEHNADKKKDETKS